MSRVVLLLTAVAALCCGLLVASPGAGAAVNPTFVQANFAQVNSGKTVPAVFATANTAGNLIVAYVVWSNTGAVSVSDSRGNVYTSAVGPTAWSNGASAQVFYARNIAAGTNTVTATFASAVNPFGLLYVHEYAGVDPTLPLDVARAATGTSGSLNRDRKSTTNASDLDRKSVG